MNRRLAYAATLYRVCGALALLPVAIHYTPVLTQGATLRLGYGDLACLLAVLGALRALQSVIDPGPDEWRHERWNQWITRRVRARALVWVLPIYLAITSIGAAFGAGTATGTLWASTPGLACGLAFITARYGPRLGPGTHTPWARSPFGYLWRWLCPSTTDTQSADWRVHSAMLAQQHPGLDGQMVIAHTQARFHLVQAHPTDTPELLFSPIDPMVLLRPEHKPLGVAVAHGKVQHALLYKAGYGGVCARGNSYIMAEHPIWLDAWLHCVGDRDPVLGEGWSITTQHSAHTLLAAAKLRHAAEPQPPTPGARAPGPSSAPHAHQSPH